MSIVTTTELKKSLNLEKFGVFGEGLSSLIMKSTGISKLNTQYDECKHLDCDLFLNEAIERLHLHYQVPVLDLNKIPKTGAFATISNHPLGGADGLILLKLLHDIRPDFKVMGNYLLHKIAPIKPLIFAVDPFDSGIGSKQNVAGLRDILKHVANGSPIGIFPAGEVSIYNKGKKRIEDKEWELNIIRLLKKLNIPIIPIYFHAKNSALFYQLAKMSSNLRTAKLPSELLNHGHKLIKVRVGTAIDIEKQNSLNNVDEYGQYLRSRTYLLEKSFIKTKGSILSHLPILNKNQLTIVNRPNLNHILYELHQLKNKILFTHNNIACFFAKLKPDSALLTEIGRMREITFRSVGEGTNQALDLDKFDNYYHHLFLWDKETDQLIGAYRIGLGKKIFEKHGKKGFYLNESFKFKKEAISMLPLSIEMGRAFITKDFQKKPMPLFLLWKGIALVTLLHPQYKYIIGSVSISNSFSDYSKSLMVAFMQSNFFDGELAKHITAKKGYKIRLLEDNYNDVLSADFKKMDKLIDEIEPDGLKIPVLLKKYIKQNAKIVAFNVDPKFNNSLDAFTYINIQNIPNTTMKPALEEFERQKVDN